MKLLDLNDSPWSLAYVRVVSALRNDPVLSRVIDPDGWRTYLDDSSGDPPGEDSLPAIEVLPFGQGASPETITSQNAPLGISISIATAGTDVRDLMNLWFAVHNAIFGGAALFGQIRADFVAMNPSSGAQLEAILLSSPAVQPSGPALQKQTMAANGTITLKMRVSK
jgi:hypothetical protein